MAHEFMRHADKVKDEIARQSRGMSQQQYAEFLKELGRQISVMASYASGNDGRPALKVVQ